MQEHNIGVLKSDFLNFKDYNEQTKILEKQQLNVGVAEKVIFHNM